jgi:ribose transport system substrate-binding protein
MLPAEIIDQTNYRAWLVPVEQRTCPEWDETSSR